MARFAASEDIYAVLDGELKCLFSSKPDLFPRGLDIIPRLNEAVALPVRERRSVGIFIRGELRCAELLPQGGHLTGRLYVCRITDYRHALETFSKTDGIFCISPAFKSLEEGMDSVLEVSEELRRTAEDNLWYDMIVRLYRIENTVRNMYAESCNMFRYFTAKEGEPAAVVDAVYLVGSLVERCNLFLTKCGRELRFLCDCESLEIAVNARHAVEALLNAIQNALLYSPRDCEPTVMMSSAEKDNVRYMRLSVSNESSVCFGRESSERLGFDFGHRHMSYGIPIIREFVSSAGGSLNISEAGGRYCLTLDIPLYGGGAFTGNVPRRIELGEYPDILFCGSRLDPVRLKMDKVVDAFGDMKR